MSDYCNTVLAGASKSVTDRLQRVLNAAARLISDTRKYDRGLTNLLHRELHWLDVPERIQYKLGTTAEQGTVLFGRRVYTGRYVASRQHLRAASRHQLVVPRHRCTTLGRRAFSVAGPMAWNALPDDVRDPALGCNTFQRVLRTFLFSKY